MLSQKPENLPITQRVRQYQAVAVAAGLAAARTTIVFHRQEIGYRILSPAAIGGTMLFLYGVQAIGNFHVAIPMVGRIGSAHPSEILGDFALAFGSVSSWQRRKRWNELLDGKRSHTRSLGISLFEFLPMRKDLIYRFVDPAVTVVAGLCIHKLGLSALGYWVVLSGLGLHVVEQFRWGRQLEADLDTLDSQIESEVAAETAAHFEGEGTGRSLRDSAGIPTGADDGLQAVIARRKKAAEGRP